jgi:hypothetical protein
VQKPSRQKNQNSHNFKQGGKTMLEQIAERLGRGLFTVCTAAGQALADVLDKGIDNICNRIENEKTEE